MTEPRLVLHIGPRKTASTYLQQNFFQNRERLEKAGWIYPVLSTTARNAHHSVSSNRAEIIKGKGSLFKRMERAAERAKGGSGLILSSEGMSSWKPRDFERLADRLGFKRVTIVFVLRDPASLVGSLWAESVKNGKTHSLPDYVDRFLSRPDQQGATNPVLLLEPLVSSSRIDLVVLNLDGVTAGGGDIFGQFCNSVLGIPAISPVRSQAANSRNPAEFSELLRLISPLAGDTKKKLGLMLGRAVERRVKPATIDAALAAIKAMAPKAAGKVVIDRDAPWHTRLQADLVGLLGDRLHPQPGADGRLFPSGPVTLVAYDSNILAADPAINRLVRKAAADLKPGLIGRLANRLANAGKRVFRLAQATLQSFRR